MVKKTFFAVTLLLPLIASLRDVVTGIIPFWVDPARDFLLAVENLSKPRLIGQPTGIPGVFYGPYTVWLTSLGLLLSKDPRFIAILTLTIPYFTLFPYLLLTITRRYGAVVFTSLWVIFIVSQRNYTTYLWNPHHAPLLFLLALLVISGLDFKAKLWRRSQKYLVIGWLIGLVANVQLSFGIALVLATLLYGLLKVAEVFLQGKPRRRILSLSQVQTFSMVVIGILLSFLPLILFELRHGFLQTKALARTMSEAMAGKSILVQGFGDREIVGYFFGSLGRLLRIPPRFTAAGYAVVALLTIPALIKNRISWLAPEKRLLAFLGVLSLVVLGLYLVAPNPIWHYHFIGVEVIFLILLGLLAGHAPALRRILAVWAAVLFVSLTTQFVSALHYNPLAVPSLASKKHIVETIYDDAQAKPFTVAVYSPSLYTFDYDYLFAWISEERGVSPPEALGSDTTIVFLVIPEAQSSTEEAFVSSTTPEEDYRTVKSWRTPDHTLLVRRERTGSKTKS